MSGTSFCGVAPEAAAWWGLLAACLRLLLGMKAPMGWGREWRAATLREAALHRA